MKIKRKCNYCNKIKIIHIDKNVPICEECLHLEKINKHYKLKLMFVILIIVLIFLLSFLIK